MSLEDEYTIDPTNACETEALVACLEAAAGETEYHSFEGYEDGSGIKFFLTPEGVAKDIEEKRPKGTGVFLVVKVDFVLLDWLENSRFRLQTINYSKLMKWTNPLIITSQSSKNKHIPVW